MSYKVQSVRLNKNYFTKKEADKYITNHGYKIGRVDITTNWYRYRQIEPSDLKAYNKIITKKLNKYLELIIYYK